MSTRTLLNLGLLVAAVTLALVAYFKPGVKPAEVPRPITRLTPEQVRSIVVERIDHEPLRFSKHHDRWFLTAEERELPAADFQVRALLRLLQVTASRHYPAGSLHLASLGLQPPQVRLTMDDVDISLGNTASLDQLRYVRVADTVYLIDDQYQYLINADWPNFVSRQLLEGRGAITRIELPGMTLASSDDGHWRLAPPQAGLSADTLQTFVENWQNATALITRRYEGGAAGETVTVRTRDSDQPLVLRIVSRKPDLLLARPDWGIQYQIPRSEEDSLFTLPKAAPVPTAESAGGTGVPATHPPAEPPPAQSP
jgi:Domain of unknown function (DUF4340)